jgi:hypothetical protein
MPLQRAQSLQANRFVASLSNLEAALRPRSENRVKMRPSSPMAATKHCRHFSLN